VVRLDLDATESMTDATTSVALAEQGGNFFSVEGHFHRPFAFRNCPLWHSGQVRSYSSSKLCEIQRYNFPISMTAHEILAAARQMSEADQHWLLRMLLRTEGFSTRAEIDEAWAVELERRVSDAESESASISSKDDDEAKSTIGIAGP